LRSLPYLM